MTILFCQLKSCLQWCNEEIITLYNNETRLKTAGLTMSKTVRA